MDKKENIKTENLTMPKSDQQTKKPATISDLYKKTQQQQQQE